MEQLELYARDVRKLHEQRTTLAIEMRRAQRRLAIAAQEQEELRDRLEQALEHVEHPEPPQRPRPRADIAQP